MQVSALPNDPIGTIIGQGDRGAGGILLTLALLTLIQAAVLVRQKHASPNAVAVLLTSLFCLTLTLILMCSTYFMLGAAQLSSGDVNESTYQDIRYIWQCMLGICNVLCFWLAFDALGLLRPVTPRSGGRVPRDLRSNQPLDCQWSPAALHLGNFTYIFAACIAATTAAIYLAVEELANNDPSGIATFLQSNCAGCQFGPEFPPSWYNSLANSLFNVCLYTFEDPVETLSSILMLPVCIILPVLAVVSAINLYSSSLDKVAGRTPFQEQTRLYQVATLVLLGTIIYLPYQFASGVGLDRTLAPGLPCGSISDTATAHAYVAWMLSNVTLRVLPMVLITSAACLMSYACPDGKSTATGRETDDMHAIMQMSLNGDVDAIIDLDGKTAGGAYESPSAPLLEVTWQGPTG
jgi:hypothetical protein